MKYIRNNSFKLKRLLSWKRHSLDEEERDNNQSFKIIHPATTTTTTIRQSCYNNNNNNNNKPTWRCFSYEEIFIATNGFSSENLVGKGGYAEVYRGVLENGMEVAVKRLTKSSTDERKEKEFLTEIGTIGHVYHPNVLSLVGCCVDNGLHLIFPFSSRGSVASLLHDDNLPATEWRTRYKIAVGTARGLHYLHKGCQRRIIHRDIKSTNILLNQDFEPQISDFGLAKWLPSQWTHHSIAPIEGTFGHLAPEYYTHGIVDEKTDVFAFGVFLLEVISGRKPVDASHQSLHSWARSIWNKGEIEVLVDPKLGGSFDADQLNRVAFAASLCIRTSPLWRPTMSEVLNVIVEGETDIERWKMPKGEEEEEEPQEFLGLEDLEYECDTSFSMSPQDSIYIGSP